MVVVGVAGSGIDAGLMGCMRKPEARRLRGQPAALLRWILRGSPVGLLRGCVWRLRSGFRSLRRGVGALRNRGRMRSARCGPPLPVVMRWVLGGCAGRTLRAPRAGHGAVRLALRRAVVRRSVGLLGKGSGRESEAEE